MCIKGIATFFKSIDIVVKIVVKMLYLTGPDGLVNQGFVNFQKIVWMTMVHIIHVHAVFFGNLHTLGLQGMQNITGFVTNSNLNNSK